MHQKSIIVVEANGSERTNVDLNVNEFRYDAFDKIGKSIIMGDMIKYYVRTSYLAAYDLFSLFFTVPSIV